MKNYDLGMVSSDISNPHSFRHWDAVVIATNHSSYDYQYIVDHARLVIDTRNATKDVTRGREKIVKA